MKPRAAVLGLALALAVPAGSAAQERPPQTRTPQARTPEAPVFTSGISLVLLPVFVVDREGRAVRGLQASDFEVQADGRKAEVVSFRYVDTTEAGEADEVSPSSAARRRFLLLFDKSFTDPAGLQRAQQAALDFVRRRLAVSDLAAVATFDINNGVRLVANFTDDRALLAHAVETLGVPTLTRISDPLGLAADFAVSDLRTSQQETTAGPDEQLQDVLRVLVKRMRQSEEYAYLRNVELLLGSLGGLARALQGVEGRKQVLYFSAGFDARLLSGESGSEQRMSGESLAAGRLWEVDGFSRFGDSNLRQALGDVTRGLAAADAVVHSIDVTGLGADRSLVQTTPSEDTVRDTTNRESLGFLATETGGRLFKDANDLGPALAEMLEMTSRYYVLGFQPEAERGPGTFHKIKVKVDRKGTKVSHRPGWFERAPVAGQTLLQRQFDLAELVVTGGDRDELPFASLCLPFPAPGERQTLGLVVQVPRDSLLWADRGPAAIEVYAYAVADDGGVRDHLAQFVQLDTRQADPEGRAQGVSLFGALSVPPGRYTLRLMVRERESGRRSVRFLDVTVPPFDGRRAFALPPLVVDEAERWLSLEMGPGKAVPESAVQPFRTPAGPFVPRASFEVASGGTERLVLVVWDPAEPGDPAADVEIRSSLTAADGRAVPAGRLRVERVHRGEGGRRTFVLSYAPEALEPGDYTLRVRLGEGGTLAEAYALLRFRPRS